MIGPQTCTAFDRREKMQAGKPMVEEALSRAGRYQTVTHNVEVKELIVGDGEARKRYIMVRNPEQQKKDEHERNSLVERLQAELDAIKKLDKSSPKPWTSKSKIWSLLPEYLSQMFPKRSPRKTPTWPS